MLLGAPEILKAPNVAVPPPKLTVPVAVNLPVWALRLMLPGRHLLPPTFLKAPNDRTFVRVWDIDCEFDA